MQICESMLVHLARTARSDSCMPPPPLPSGLSRPLGERVGSSHPPRLALPNLCQWSLSGTAMPTDGWRHCHRTPEGSPRNAGNRAGVGGVGFAGSAGGRGAARAAVATCPTPSAQPCPAPGLGVGHRRERKGGEGIRHKHIIQSGVEPLQDLNSRTKDGITLRKN